MVESIERIIHFYELGIGGDKPHTNESVITNLKAVFQQIIALNKENNPSLYKHGGEMITITDAVFEPEKMLIKGKIVKVRMDMFPELFNTQDSTTKDIDAKEEEDLLEVAHFIIHHGKTPIVALENNHYGAKSVDFCRYLTHICTQIGIKVNFTCMPIVNDTLSSFSRRIQRCSCFNVKVHKDNIARIQNIDDDLVAAIVMANKFGDSDYVEIELKFDYKSKVATKTITEKVKNIIAKLLQNREYPNYFHSLFVRAEDSDKENKLEVFDLLSDKLRSIVSVQRRGRTKAIISLHMFMLLEEELENKIINSIN